MKKSLGGKEKLWRGPLSTRSLKLNLKCLHCSVLSDWISWFVKKIHCALMELCFKIFSSQDDLKVGLWCSFPPPSFFLDFAWFTLQNNAFDFSPSVRHLSKQTILSPFPLNQLSSELQPCCPAQGLDNKAAIFTELWATSDHHVKDILPKTAWNWVFTEGITYSDLTMGNY